MRLIDLTHTFDETVAVYPGDPKPEISASADASGLFTLTEVRAGLHTGTHIDGPAHLLGGGPFISEIPVGRFIGRGVLIDARSRQVVDADILSRVSLMRGDVVLVLTGFSGKFGEDSYFAGHPVMTPRFAESLVKAEASILGVDSPGPDREPYDIHRILLTGNVLILENLTNLESLIGAGSFEVIAMPVRIKAEAAPVRVVARLLRDPA